MANFTLTRPDVFPEGTSVKALKRSNYLQGEKPPTQDRGTADSTVNVTNGAAAFTGLADGMGYYAAATVGGIYRVIRFDTPTLQAAQTVGAGSLTDIARNRGYQRPGAIAENFNRAGTAGSATITSGTLRVVGMLMLPAGRPVSSITFCSGGTPAGTPANQWFCLIDPNTRNVLATTLDDLAAAWAINSEKTLQIASALGGSTPGPYTPSSEIAVQAGILVVAATPPSLLAAGTSTTLAGLAPALSVNSSTGLTTPASLGAQAAAYGAAAATVPWMYVS